jgi:hypothetical protein
METIKVYKNQKEYRDIIYNPDSYKVFPNDIKEYKCFKLSIYNNIFKTPLPLPVKKKNEDEDEDDDSEVPKQKYSNSVQLGTSRMNVVFDIKPYLQEPFCKKFTAGLLGTLSDGNWNPPEDDLQRKETLEFQQLISDFDNEIVPQLIMKLDDKHKETIRKLLKIKETPLTLEAVKEKIVPSMVRGEFNEKLYYPQMNFKFPLKFDDETKKYLDEYDMILFERESYTDDNGNKKTRTVMNQKIYENMLNMGRELPRGTVFKGVITPSVFIKDKIIIQWAVQRVTPIKRPPKVQNDIECDFEDEFDDTVCDNFEFKVEDQQPQKQPTQEKVEEPTNQVDDSSSGDEDTDEDSD